MMGRRAFQFLLISSLLVLAALPAYAQGGNLLTNPGFEPPFQTVSGEPPRSVAQGWTPWHLSDPDASFSELIQPEYYPASDDTNGLGIPRIRSGNDAQQYFTFFATHTGGVYQTVTGVSSGTQYRFQVYAYVWSTSMDSVDVSQDPGGVIVQVGIDPTGGSNAASASIVWSAAGAPQYDAYVPYEVTTAAQGSSVTVFVRSTVSSPVKNTVVYLDDASLSTGGGSTSVPSANTATSVPPTNVFPTDAASAVPATGVPATAVPATTVPSTAAPSTTGPTAVPPTQPAVASATQTTPPTAASTATNTVPPTPSGPTFTPSPSPTVDRVSFPNSIIHTVQSGDTVGRLATLYGSTIDGIISANGLNPNGLIFVGQGLVIPVRLLPPATQVPTVPPVILMTATPVSGVPATPAPTAVPVEPAQPATTTYVVVPGDTLYSVAVRFRTTITTLAQLNNIVNRNLIYYGQRLIVPTGAPQPAPIATAIVLQPGQQAPTVTPVIIRTYRVQLGDNLFNIALRFNVPLSTLTQYNGILNQNRIFVGQVLVIP